MSATILLIEDEPSIAQAVAFVLAREGFRVETHADGVSAVQAVQARRPDLLILDVMLPGRSGYEVLRELRGDPAMARLPILLLTARGQRRDRELGLELGADLVMTKPFSNRELVATVRRLLAGSGREVRA